ncbi:hypothetical protein D3C87_242990 [compost metagenome]
MKLLPIFIFCCFLQYAYISKAQSDVEHPMAVQLNVGTQGIGAAFNYGVTKNLAIRTGINAIPIKANDVFKISGFNSTSHVSADFYNIHLLADYTPFEQQRWFRLVAGAAYFIKANGNVRIVPSDDYKFGDLTLTEEQVGYVDLNVDWQGIAPYLGIAFFRSFPKNKFNVNLDLGTYYLPKPNAEIIGTGILTGNSSQTDQFRSNIKDYRWLPILQINFNYKF